MHYAANSRHLMGGTALKRRLLRRLGWRPVSVPFFEWSELPPARRGPYMRQKLEEAGLQLSELQAAPEPLQAAAAGAAAAAEAPAAAAAAAEALAAEAPAAGAAAAAEAAAAQSPAPETAADAQQVAERAKRLSMLHYRRGKLSRQGLVARQAVAAAGTAAAAAAAAFAEEQGAEHPSPADGGSESAAPEP